MKTVEVRPEKVLWLVVGIFVLMSLVFLSPLAVWIFLGAKPPAQKEKADFIFVVIFALAVSVGTIISVVSMLRSRLIADEEGLKWRGTFGPWRRARWEEVTDFYLVSSLENGRKIIEIGEKKIFLAGANAGIVAGMVAERAVNAPFRVWQMQVSEGVSGP